MNKIMIILGPTSTGKTDLGLFLAKKFNGELVSADSRQVYKDLDIGTGKLPESGNFKKGKGFWEIDGIKIWMYDVVSPNTQYNVAQYIKDAEKIVSEILKKGKLPIIVGGTGLYIKALIDGLPNLSIPIDKKLRKKLEKLSLSDLQKKLRQLSTKRWEIMNDSDRQNPRRLIRAIEIVILSGAKDLPRMWDSNKLRDSSLIVQNDSSILKIGLTANRSILYKRSDDRLISRMKQGMIEEAQRLQRSGISLKRFRQLGLEYGILADYLDGKIKSEDSLVTILQFKIHGYIRRQQTWFKKETNINWFDVSQKSYVNKIEKLVRKWYD